LEYFPEFNTELKKIIYSMYEKTRGQKSHATVNLIEWHRKQGFGEDLIKMAREMEVPPAVPTRVIIMNI
jgi:hypothetical protein